MSAITVWSIIFFCIGYLIITDQSVAKAFYMLTQLAKIQYEKTKWWVRYSPDNPIVRWTIHRRSVKMAKELLKEFEEKNR